MHGATYTITIIERDGFHDVEAFDPNGEQIAAVGGVLGGILHIAADCIRADMHSARTTR
jgi:hypothetical protein